MATLDGIERRLEADALLIADPKRPIALAGVMGGADSEIREETQRVLLESAYFAPPGIRKTSSRLGLSTESSHRFERGVDIGGVDWASRRAAALMVELAGAEAAAGVIDVFPGGFQEKRTRLRYRKTRDLLGIDIPDDEIVAVLESLQIPVVEQDAESCTVSPPTFRPDLDIEADLIEEVARLHGLEQVPDAIPRSRIATDANDRAIRAVETCRSHLTGLGLNEIVTYSFVSQALLDTFTPGESASRVVLPNPVSRDHGIMRPSLVPQMVESLGKNLARQVTDAAFFEIGRVFLKTETGAVREEERVAIGLMGPVGRGTLTRKQPVGPEESFLWLKGIVQSLCASHHVENLGFVNSQVSFFEEGMSATVTTGSDSVGVLGIVSPAIRREWRMLEPIAVAELALAPLVTHVCDAPTLRPIPEYPAVSRDIAVIVDETVSHESILRIIRKNGGRELTRVDLFDIFKSEEIGDNRKSLAYSLVFRSLTGTLTDEDANRCHQKVKDALKKELNAEIRES
jgi:phenylalanyl-tRNA synthetase beta chain